MTKNPPNILTAAKVTATNPNISTNDVVTGPGISGTVTVTNISGTQLTLSSNQTIAKGAPLSCAPAL